MNIKEYIKDATRVLKRCERWLGKENISVLYWQGTLVENKINLSDDKNKDIVSRIELRSDIRDLNKKINGFLASRLQAAGYEPKPYLKRYWDEIISGFAAKEFKMDRNLQNMFLEDKTSPLYRKFPNCLSAKTMESYISYLNYYLQMLSLYGHKGAIRLASESFLNDENIKVEFAQPALPDNWDKIYEQMQILKEISRSSDKTAEEREQN